MATSPRWITSQLGLKERAFFSAPLFSRGFFSSFSFGPFHGFVRLFLPARATNSHFSLDVPLACVQYNRSLIFPSNYFRLQQTKNVFSSTTKNVQNFFFIFFLFNLFFLIFIRHFVFVKCKIDNCKYLSLSGWLIFWHLLRFKPWYTSGAFFSSWRNS